MGVRHGFAPALRGYTQVPPYKAFDLIGVGAELRVRPGQRMPMQNSDAHTSVGASWEPWIAET